MRPQGRIWPTVLPESSPTWGSVSGACTLSGLRRTTLSSALVVSIWSLSLWRLDVAFQQSSQDMSVLTARVRDGRRHKPALREE